MPAIVAIFIFNSFVSAQETIKTITAFKHKVNYNFSADWQYLSTDLYLMNANKFSDLLNEISRLNSGKQSRKFNKEILQSLFIKAKIKNIRFFGGDVVYPIYNFKVTETKENTIVETGNSEVVRLIDNLPLNESNEVIDAEITGEAITDKNSNDFLRLIGAQLQSLSSTPKPNVSVLGLVGELGKFIESKATGGQYKFSSTIRLYEGQDFNKRLHSINIFVLSPSSVSKVNLMADNLLNFIDTSLSPQINQSILDKMISYKKYPMIVTVNYKSRYNSHPVIGDQINYDYLAERKLKIQNAYQNELINKFTYNQELKLIEFLEIFSELKLNINNYKLNLKNDITNDYSKNLFVILKIYNNLLNIKKMRIIEFSSNPEFINEFLPKYESVLNTAMLYLNETSSLANIKEAALVIDANIDPNTYADKSEVCESNLRFLYSVVIPEDEEKFQLTKDLERISKNIEQAYFSRKYSPVIRQINSLTTDDNGLSEKEKVESKFGNTYCKTCKNEFSKAIEAYNVKYQNVQTSILLMKNEEVKQKVVSLIISSVEKRKCIDKYLNSADSLSGYNDILKAEAIKFDTLINETKETIKLENNKMTATQLKEHVFLLEAYIKRLDLGISNLCKYMNINCDCKNN
jgi:hypothetical protein